MQSFRIYSQLTFLHGTLVTFHDIFGEGKNVLSLVILYQTKMLQGRNHVFFSNTRPFTNIAARKTKLLKGGYFFELIN